MNIPVTVPMAARSAAGSGHAWYVVAVLILACTIAFAALCFAGAEPYGAAGAAPLSLLRWPGLKPFRRCVETIDF